MAFNMRFCVRVMLLTLLRTWPTIRRGGGPDLQSWCRGHGERLQRRTPRVPLPTRAFSLIHEVGGAICFGARQTHRSGPWHSPREGAKEKRRETWCTTAAQTEHGDLQRERAEMPSGSGCARSSGEFVATLCAAGLQDGAASAGAHTRTEPVLAGFATIIGLKGALHGASCETSSVRSTRSMSVPVPAARDERIHRLTRSKPVPTPKVTLFGLDLRSSTTSSAQILDIHKSCYGHLSHRNTVGSHPHPVDCAVDESSGGRNE